MDACVYNTAINTVLHEHMHTHKIVAHVRLPPKGQICRYYDAVCLSGATTKVTRLLVSFFVETHIQTLSCENPFPPQLVISFLVTYRIIICKVLEGTGCVFGRGS